MARGVRAPGSPGPWGGHSLVELLVALAILGVLAGLGGLGRPPGNPALTAVQGELRASVEQAFHQARARGRPVRLVLGAPAPGRGDGDLRPLNLPRGVRWGLPPEVPLPPGMKDTLRAQYAGAAHACITVTPWRTATANAWFLTDGRDAICLRLEGHGRLTLLRWRHHPGRWERA